MKRIVAILSGGDWADAGVDHLVIEDNVDLNEEKKLHNDSMQSIRDLRDEVFQKRFDPNFYESGDFKNLPPILTFSEWLIKKGIAREPTDDELIEFSVSRET